MRHSRDSMPNRPIQRTRATKRLGVFKFRVVARGADRGRWAPRFLAIGIGTE
jgi:hypothetical protein